MEGRPAPFLKGCCHWKGIRFSKFCIHQVKSAINVGGTPAHFFGGWCPRNLWRRLKSRQRIISSLTKQQIYGWQRIIYFCHLNSFIHHMKNTTLFFFVASLFFLNACKKEAELQKIPTRRSATTATARSAG